MAIAAGFVPVKYAIEELPTDGDASHIGVAFGVATLNGEAKILNSL